MEACFRLPLEVQKRETGDKAISGGSAEAVELTHQEGSYLARGQRSVV